MNATMNGSIASCSGLINPTAEKIGQTVACCLIFIVSLVGNSSIALIVYKTQALRKPINFFIVNLAMSDLLSSLFWFPLQLTQLYANSSIIVGSLEQALLCKTVRFLGHVSMLVSIQSLVLIAVDRFGAVIFPLRSPLISSKMCPFFILGTWIVAMAVFSRDLFISFEPIEYQAGGQMCFYQWNDSSSQAVFSLSLIVVFVYIPIASLALLYYLIVAKLKSQNIPGEHSDNAEEQRARRNKNVTKMAIAIVSGFVLCWVPYTVITLLRYFAWNRFSYCEFVLLWHIAGFMASANGAINPIVCFIFSGNYREGLKRLLKIQ